LHIASFAFTGSAHKKILPQAPPAHLAVMSRPGLYMVKGKVARQRTDRHPQLLRSLMLLATAVAEPTTFTFSYRQLTLTVYVDVVAGACTEERHAVAAAGHLLHVPSCHLLPRHSTTEG